MKPAASAALRSPPGSKGSFRGLAIGPKPTTKRQSPILPSQGRIRRLTCFPCRLQCLLRRPTKCGTACKPSRSNGELLLLRGILSPRDRSEAACQAARPLSLMLKVPVSDGECHVELLLLGLHQQQQAGDLPQGFQAGLGRLVGTQKLRDPTPT